MIFDTHAHYDDHSFDEDREDVLHSLSGYGVGRVLDVGSTISSLARILELVNQYDFLYGALGLHPDEVGPHGRKAGTEFSLPAVCADGRRPASGMKGHAEGLTPEILDWLRAAIRSPKIVAVGEIGLDYHWNIEPRDVQIRAFKEQIQIAVEADKPILVHSRSAAEDTMRVIQEMYGAGEPGRKVARQEALKKLLPDQYAEVPGKEWVWKKEIPEGPGHGMDRKGIIHAYAYSAEQARIYTELGFYLGIGGVLTYMNSRKLKKVVRDIPLEYLVLETDCPYLAPEPVRGERNHSGNLTYVAAAIAEIKGISREEVERVTWENACRLFSL